MKKNSGVCALGLFMNIHLVVGVLCVRQRCAAAVAIKRKEHTHRNTQRRDFCSCSGASWIYGNIKIYGRFCGKVFPLGCGILHSPVGSFELWKFPAVCSLLLFNFILRHTPSQKWLPFALSRLSAVWTFYFKFILTKRKHTYIRVCFQMGI